MKTPRILATGIAALLAISLPARAQTWDGGGANDFLLTAANWNPDGVPTTSADVIFGGIVRLTPNLSGSFQVNSLTFNNTAGAFVFGGASILSIKAGGLINNDTTLQTFNNPVSFGLAATSTINAASGALALNGAVTLATTTLTLDGANAITFGSTITGTGAITKSGTGAFNFDATATAIGADFNLNAGTTTLVATGTTQTLSSTSAVAVNGGSIFNINESLTLGGAQLTRAVGGTLNLAAGKTLNVQNGGDAIITGGFTNSTASTIIVTGVGSTFTTTSTLDISGGSTTNVLAGGSISAAGGNSLFIGTNGNGTVTVDGGGSSATAGSLLVGISGFAGSLTFSNGSTGTFGSVGVDSSGNGGTAGTLNILSGAAVSGTSLIMAANFVANSGVVTINGAGSSLTLTGAATANIGAAGLSTGALNVQSGGTFNSGTGLTTVNATGTIAITGGTFNANGNLTLNGGDLTRDAAGVFILAAGRTLTVQGGSHFTITGIHTNSTASSFTVTGAGSTLSASSSLAFNGGSAVSVLAGGSVASAAGVLGIGAIGSGTMTVDGAGSSVSGVTVSVAGSGIAANGSLTLSNTATGSFGGTSVGVSTTVGAIGTMTIQSGATASMTGLSIASLAVANSGSVTITGAGSAMTLTGATSSAIGASSASSAFLTIDRGGAFTANTGTFTVNTTGTVNLVNGTFNANGNVTVSGGHFTAGSGGNLNLAATRTLSFTNGGVGSFSSDLGLGTANSKLTVSGNGSTITGFGLQAYTNNTITVSGGGDALFTDLFLGIGAAAASATITGAGSTFSTTNNTEIYNGTLTYSLGSSGSMGPVAVDADPAGLVGVTGTLLVQSGSALTATNTKLATSGSVGASNASALTVTGAGSAYTQTGVATLQIGSSNIGAGISTGTLNVADGGTYTSGTGSISLNTSGTINIDGGTVTLNGPLERNGGAVTFTSGALSIIDIWNVGVGGLLGANVTFDATRRVTTTATTNVDAFNTLTLNGGTLRTSALVNSGTVAFNSGTLAITGAGGFNIGTGALGANVTLGTGANLQVTNTTTVASGALLRMNGGSFSGASITNNGTIDHQDGALDFTGTLTNSAGGRLFVGGLASPAGAITNAGRITMQNGIGLLGGAGAITNTGIITGDGTIGKPVTNSVGGSIRAEAGKTLFFTGTTGTNTGRLDLLGGTLQFTQQFTNAATGQINGQGALYFSTTPVPSLASPTAGLMNAGTINLTGGDSQIYGTVQMQAGSRLTVSGGATASFFDVFRHSGLDVKASAGSNIVFFGEVRGAGSFSGTGTTYFEGGYSPGNSPALVTFGGSVVYGTFNTVFMELGGTARGTQYDAINVAGKLTFDGGLTVPLISGFQPQAGNVFNLFDFGTKAGTFTTVNLPVIAPGLLWSQANLYTAGEIQVALDPVFISRTWDGGGVNNNWITDTNWTLDVQPLNNATADLIFTGNVRLAPSVDTPWNVRSITFNNAAEAFTITGPQGITIGNGGIVNNDPQTQTITAAITLSAHESFNAAAGDLAITSVALAGQTLAITGANDVTLATASGTGIIDKNNAGRLDITGILGTGGVTLHANTGATNIGASETLAVLNIGNGATVTLGAIPPPAPPFGGEELLTGSPSLPVPEPGALSLLAIGLAALIGRPGRGVRS